VLVAGVGLGGALGRVLAQGNSLPPGENRALVLGACIPCHSPETVAQQRLDRATWEAVVDRMISYGAPISRQTRPLIVEYLATYLKP
jgi:hypothetical protein